MRNLIFCSLTLVACSGQIDSDTGGTGDGSGENGSGSEGSGEGGSDGGSGSVGTSDLVDDDCLDGQYSETLPNPDADISGPLNNYSSSNVIGFLEEVLDRRYPIGSVILMGGYEDPGYFPENCVDYFLRDSSSGQAVTQQMSTLVHECGHFYDINSSDWGEDAYHITDELLFTCSDGSTPDNGGGVTFSRSLINNDEFSDLHPPCASFGGSNCDSYAYIYLDGNPNDGAFDSGDQGFNMLHEETVQYINSLATSYAFQDQKSYTVSARDGILTFLWYTTRYLRMARLEHPDTYNLLSEDACWRELILTTWGRAWLFLELTEDNNALGIDDAFLEDLVREPVLVEEIQRLRDLQGCD